MEVALLLAAGAGTRMGMPKALARRDEQSPRLIVQALATLRAGGIRRVVIVTGAASDEVIEVIASAAAALGEQTRIEVVEASDWSEGMSASLRAGLEHLAQAHPPEQAMVTLVDLVDLTPAVLTRMHLEVMRLGLEQPHTPATAVLARAAYDGAPGHPVVLGRDHWAGVMDTATGDRGARDYLATREVTLIECGDLSTGADADRPADL